MFKDDREFIENKYHKTDEDFNPYQRMGYHGYEFDNSTGLEDEEIRAGLLKLYEDIKFLPHGEAKALAIKYVLENTKIDAGEHDYFVGLWSVGRLAYGITLERWKNEVFENLIPEAGRKMEDMNNSGAVSIWPDFDHVVPDWESVLSLGFSGLLNRARKYREKHLESGGISKEKADFFKGIEIEYSAIISFIDRLYRLAEKQNHKKAKSLSKCLKSIRDGAPQNIYEAMQVIYIYFMISECFDFYQVRSLGNGLDRALFPFYERDLKTGNYKKEEIREILKYFLMQWQAIGNYWGQPFYLGGTNVDGETKYNELSYEILDVYDEMGIYNPKIQLKINENTPEKILNKAFDMVRRGNSSIVFCCEPAMIKAVMSYGATYEEALDMDIRGCYETGVRANEVSTGTGYINAVKAVLYVFSNGYDEKLKKTFGVKTGEIEDFKTFEDFYAAVLKQLENLIDMTVEVSREYEKFMGRINPSSMYSATIERALRLGEDAYQSGVKFSNSAILNCGLASLVNSVMAVKEFVFDKKAVSLSEMKSALDNNWNGFERIRTMILKSPHKYGNGDIETDLYTEAISEFFTSKVNNRKNARGGVYKSVLHSAMQFVWQGEATGATPDGRYAGEELSKNASPTVGSDKNGVTALISSALKTNPKRYIESCCLDVMLHPSAVSGDEGLLIMKSLLFTYMKGDGMSMQFNVFNAETLKDAQKHPEKYKNLQVRVCGWNVLWNNLSEKEQNAYIKRAENI